MRTVIGWALILHALHLPVPFPDLDGECRGTPISSLAELHAWHVVMLGIRPGADVDRGPIGTDHDPQSHDPDNLLFAGSAIVMSLSGGAISPFAPTPPTLHGGDAFLLQHALTTDRLQRFSQKPEIPIGRAACVRFCSWQV